MMFKPLSGLSSVLLISASLFGILAAAAPIANATDATTTTLTKRQAVQSCIYDNDFFYTDWAILVDNDDQFDRSGCGIGFLDNVRGRSGAITGWTCDYTEGSDIYMHFQTSTFCKDTDISAAMNAATYGSQNIPCTWVFAPGSSEE